MPPIPKVYLKVAKGYAQELLDAWKAANKVAADNPIALTIGTLWAGHQINASKTTAKPDPKTHDYIEVDDD